MLAALDESIGKALSRDRAGRGFFFYFHSEGIHQEFEFGLVRDRIDQHNAAQSKFSMRTFSAFVNHRYQFRFI